MALLTGVAGQKTAPSRQTIKGGPPLPLSSAPMPRRIQEPCDAKQPQ
jgi:hypothetical protein